MTSRHVQHMTQIEYVDAYERNVPKAPEEKAAARELADAERAKIRAMMQ